MEEFIIEVETRGKKQFYKSVINNEVKLVDTKPEAFKLGCGIKAARVKDLVQSKRPQSLVSIIELV